MQFGIQNVIKLVKYLGVQRRSVFPQKIGICTEPKEVFHAGIQQLITCHKSQLVMQGQILT